MIGTITNTVVALMIVTTGYKEIEGFETEWRSCYPEGSERYNWAGRYVHKTWQPEKLYRKISTTNFVYKSEYSPFSFEDIVVDDGKYPVIQAVKTNVWHSPSPVYLDSKCGGECKEGDKK